MSVNKVLLIGNVGRDPEVKTLPGGAVVANFTLATSERYKDAQERTEWHECVCWNGLAELVRSYVRKGSQIYVEGHIRSRSWEDQEGQKHVVKEIHVETIQFLTPKQQGGDATQRPRADQEQQLPPRRPKPAPQPVDSDVDDLPF